MTETINNSKLGLIKLRRMTGHKPTYKCDNCECMRYSPCGCQRKEKK